MFARSGRVATPDAPPSGRRFAHRSRARTEPSRDEVAGCGWPSTRRSVGTRPCAVTVAFVWDVHPAPAWRLTAGNRQSAGPPPMKNLGGRQSQARGAVDVNRPQSLRRSLEQRPHGCDRIGPAHSKRLPSGRVTTGARDRIGSLEVAPPGPATRGADRCGSRRDTPARRELRSFGAHGWPNSRRTQSALVDDDSRLSRAQPAPGAPPRRSTRPGCLSRGARAFTAAADGFGPGWAVGCHGGRVRPGFAVGRDESGVGGPPSSQRPIGAVDRGFGTRAMLASRGLLRRPWPGTRSGSQSGGPRLSAAIAVRVGCG